MFCRFDASLEWLCESINMRDVEIEAIRKNEEMDESAKKRAMRIKGMKSVDEVLEDVKVLIDTNFLNEFSEKSSRFMK